MSRSNAGVTFPSCPHPMQDSHLQCDDGKGFPRSPVREDTVARANRTTARIFAQAKAGGSSESIEVETLTAQSHRAWESYVHAHADGTFFHTLAWRDAVSNTFPHDAFYLVATANHRIVGVLPMFLVASRIAGRLLVSVPYGVGGGILADDERIAVALFTAAKQIGDAKCCVMIDLRSERPVLRNLPVLDAYVGFRRTLPLSVGEVLGWLPRKARAAARNARHKYNLTASFGDENLAEVWRLYSLSMRRLASINYPQAFFKRLAESTPDRHWTVLVSLNGQPVAGLVTFLFRDRVMPYFLGTSGDATRCSAANFIYLTIMERAVACGYRIFDFGRSRRENVGGCNFKRFNGFDPQPLGYQYYIPPGRQPVNLSPTNPRFRAARALWPSLPLFLTRALGARLARHIPG